MIVLMTQSSPHSTTLISLMIYAQRNFWIANAVNALFFSGYWILKFPLAFILSQQGIPLHDAYALTTTSSIAFALCSIALTWILKEYRNQKHLFLLGIILNLLATVLLDTRYYNLEIMGLSCYVIGGSLYFFNITLLFNKQFSTARERLHGNYLAQIGLNGGAFVGTIVFLLSASTDHHYFADSIGFMLSAFLLLCISYRFLKDNTASCQQKKRLYCCCFLLFLLIVFCLQHTSITRWIILCVFLIAIIAAIMHATRHRDTGYFIFIVLIVLFSFPFWIGNTILYNQFFVLLHNHVSLMIGLPATFIIALDPLGNIVFGLLWVRM